MVNDNQDDWDQFIDSTLFSTRVKIQMTTKFSPFYLMYHREAKVPTQITMPQPVIPVSTLKILMMLKVVYWPVSASLTRHIHCLRSIQFVVMDQKLFIPIVKQCPVMSANLYFLSTKKRI